MCQTLRAERARSIPTKAVTVYASHVGTNIVILGGCIVILDVVAQVGFKVNKQMSQTIKNCHHFFKKKIGLFSYREYRAVLSVENRVFPQTCPQPFAAVRELNIRGDGRHRCLGRKPSLQFHFPLSSTLTHHMQQNLPSIKTEAMFLIYNRCRYREFQTFARSASGTPSLSVTRSPEIL